MNDICRYCFDGEDEKNPLLNKLIFPCDCNTPVHKKCIKQWIETSNSNNCEICNKKYNGIVILKRKSIKFYCDIFISFSLLYFCFCVFICDILFGSECPYFAIQIMYGSFISILLFYVVIYKINECYKIYNNDLTISLIS